MQKQKTYEKGKWLGPEEVRLLSFRLDKDGDPICIGGNVFGDIYAGRMRFEDGSVQRVAIKRFKTPIDTGRAEIYEDVIKRLKDALKTNDGGSSLPKMGMIQLAKGTHIGHEKLSENEWVQVSSLFTKTHNGYPHSKIENKSSLYLKDPKTRREAVEIFCKTANAGIPPMEDLLEPFQEKSGVIPIDIDLIVSQVQRFGLPNNEMLAKHVDLNINAIARFMDSQKERDEYENLYSLSLKILKPEIAKELKKAMPDFRY